VSVVLLTQVSRVCTELRLAGPSLVDGGWLTCPDTHRPAAAIGAHVAVDLEASRVVGGEDRVDAIILLPIQKDVQTVPGPRACDSEDTTTTCIPVTAPSKTAHESL
jgi:hypothetical protein